MAFLDLGEQNIPNRLYYETNWKRIRTILICSTIAWIWAALAIYGAWELIQRVMR